MNISLPRWVEKARIWIYLPQEKVDNFDDKLLAQMRSLCKNLGKFDAAEARITQLNKFAAQKFKGVDEKYIQLFICAAIGFSFSNAIQIMTDGLGPLAPIISWLLGTALSWFLDTQAIKIFITLRWDKILAQALEYLNEQKKDNPLDSILGRAYYAGQKSCIKNVEGNQALLVVDVVLALMITVIEYCAAFYIVNQLSLHGDLIEEMMKILTAALPPAAVWLAALVQSYLLEMPKRAVTAIKEYEQILSRFEGAESEKFWEDYKDEVSTTNGRFGSGLY